MESKGGNFAKKLAEALWIADKSNYNIAIKSFWHTFKPYIKKELYVFHYWKYSNIPSGTDICF